MPLNLEVLQVVINSVIEMLKDLNYLAKNFGKDCVVKVNLDKFGTKTIDWGMGKAGLNQDFVVVMWNVLYENGLMRNEDLEKNLSAGTEFELTVGDCIEECLNWIKLKEDSGWNGVEKGTWEILKEEYKEYEKCDRNGGNEKNDEKNEKNDEKEKV